jgi:hypothetical protein
VYFYVVLRDELEDTDVKRLQIIAYSKLAPATAESAYRTLAVIDIVNIPRLSLWIPQFYLPVGTWKTFPCKFTRDSLQYKEVTQERDKKKIRQVADTSRKDYNSDKKD